MMLIQSCCSIKIFRYFLEISRFTFEIELDLSWSKNYIIPEILNITEAAVNPKPNPPVAHFPEGFTNSATFQINNAKLHVPVFTLSIHDNIKFLENIKQGFKRIISWN